MNIVTSLKKIAAWFRCLYMKAQHTEAVVADALGIPFDQHCMVFDMLGLRFTHVGRPSLFNRVWSARFHEAFIFITCSGLPRKYRVFGEFNGTRYTALVYQAPTMTLLTIEEAVAYVIAEISALPEMEEPEEPEEE